MSSLAEMATIFLTPKHRDAVLGDLAETVANGWSTLGSVLGLVVRQQMEFWRAWQPWVASSMAFAGSFLLLSVSFGLSVDSRHLLRGISSSRRVTPLQIRSSTPTTASAELHRARCHTHARFPPSLVPVLAIFACPHSFDFDRMLENNPALKARVVEEDTFTTTRQADAFTSGVPSSHVVRIANADHYVFRSNEADVIKEMDAFLSTLH